MGRTKSGDMASGVMGNLALYMISFSSTTTGFGSLTAAFSNPVTLCYYGYEVGVVEV